MLAQSLLGDEPGHCGKSAVHCISDERIQRVVVEVANTVIVQWIARLCVEETLKEIGKDVLTGNVVVVLVQSPADTSILKILTTISRISPVLMGKQLREPHLAGGFPFQRAAVNGW